MTTLKHMSDDELFAEATHLESIMAGEGEDLDIRRYGSINGQLADVEDELAERQEAREKVEAVATMDFDLAREQELDAQLRRAVSVK